MTCCRKPENINKETLLNDNSYNKEIKETAEYDVGTYESAPSFIRDNEYIKRGYRNNFNSKRKILRSLFMIHNESINVWTHLIGLLFIFVLFFYTAYYISTHNFFIKEIQGKFKEIKSDLGDYATIYLEKIPSVEEISKNINEKYQDSKILISDIASTVSSKTKDYLHIVDNKINEYTDFIQNKINCFDCLKDLISAISSMDNLKESIIKESKGIISSLEALELRKRLDELNEKLMKFKNDLLEKLESKEMEWIDIYKNSEKYKNPKIKKWPVFVMLFGAVACLSGSSIFHLFSAHSEKYNQFLSRLDYAGISLLIMGSCYPPYYYYFFCRENLRLFYMTLVTLLCCSTFCFSLTEGFNSPPKRKLRGILFISLGIAAGIPIVHMMFIGNAPGMIQDGNFSFWIIGGISYIGGACIYIWRIPEKYWPGKFCLVGNSHQIWHCLVLGGIICHYLACLNCYHDRLQHSECYN